MLLQIFRCLLDDCSCENFASTSERTCENCHHAWLSHVIKPPYQEGQTGAAEAVSPPGLFELAPAVLRLTQAIPIRLKILLDRLFVSLDDEEQRRILQSLGWSLEDYSRGYIAQDSNGDQAEEWTICSDEDESTILRQFLKLDETRSLAASFLAKRDEEDALQVPSPPVALAHPSSTAGHFSPSTAIFSRSLHFDSRSNPPASPTGSALFPAPSPDTRACRSEELMGSRQGGGSPDLDSSSRMDADDQPEDLSTNKSSATMLRGAAELDNYLSKTPTTFGVQLQQLFNSKTLKRIRQSASLFKRRSPLPIQQCDKGPIPRYSGSGKRRVQCETCLKTFCDKGALKIHFSAVHLKEMHMCTVEGCTQMFSSRRSRNRHSGNRNPKLHGPQAQRKAVRPPPGCRVVSPLGAAAHFQFPSNGELQLSEAVTEQEAKNGNGVPVETVETAPTPERVEPQRSRRKNVQPTKLSQPTMEEPMDATAMLQNGQALKTEENSTESIHDDSSPLDFSQISYGEKKLPQDAIRCLADMTDSLKAVLPPKSESAGTQQETQHALSRSSNYSVDSLISPDGVYHAAQQEGGIEQPGQSATVSTCSSPDGDDDGEGDESMFSMMGDESPMDDVMMMEDVEGGQITHVLCKTAKGSVKVPINERDPKRCVACKREFQNHFSVKTHFINVHLKVPNACTIPGCNAVFPSKRSRDRHSQNENLHRKLLSGPRDGVTALPGSMSTGSVSNLLERKSTTPSKTESPHTFLAAPAPPSPSPCSQVAASVTPSSSEPPSTAHNTDRIGSDRLLPTGPPSFLYQNHILPFATAPGLLQQLQSASQASAMGLNPGILAAHAHNAAAAAALFLPASWPTLAAALGQQQPINLHTASTQETDKGLQVDRIKTDAGLNKVVCGSRG